MSTTITDKDEIRKGRDLILKYNNVKVGRVMSMTLNVDGNVIDVSDDDSGEWTDYIRGRKDWTMSLTAHTVEHASGSVQAEITEDFVDTTNSGSVEFAPESPQTDDVIYTGDVYTTNFLVDKSDSDDAIESSWEFQGSGALTRSVQA